MQRRTAGQRASDARQLRRARLEATFAPLGVAAVAVLARTLEALQNPLVFNDGPRFIAVAEAMQRGEWRTAFSEPFHPLTSAAMALVSSLCGLTVEASGELICVLSGGVAAASLYVLTRAQFGITVATLAGLAFAVHPRLVQSSSGVQSDGLYLAATVLAIACIWRALSTGRAGAAAAAGMACGTAYLVRPEGLLVALVFGGWLAADLLRRRAQPARALEQAAAFAATLALVAAPYVLALHSVTGTWTLTQKKSAGALVGLSSDIARASGPAPFETLSADLGAAEPTLQEEAPHAVASGVSWAVRLASALGEMLYDFLRAFTPTALVLALIGLRREALSRASAFLLTHVGAIALLLLGLHLSAGYVSRRHWLVAATVLLPFSARGVLRLAGFLSPRLPTPLRRRWVAPALGAAALAGFLIHSALPDDEADKRARQRAAEWLREAEHPSVVATMRARDAYYAGATRHVALAHLSAPEAIVSAARVGGARFMLVDEALLLGSAAAQLGAVEVHRVPYPGGSVGVFEVR
jgi:hypothetical protein